MKYKFSQFIYFMKNKEGGDKEKKIHLLKGVENMTAVHSSFQVCLKRFITSLIRYLSAVLKLLCIL